MWINYLYILSRFLHEFHWTCSVSRPVATLLFFIYIRPLQATQCASNDSLSCANVRIDTDHHWQKLSLIAKGTTLFLNEVHRASAMFDHDYDPNRLAPHGPCHRQVVTIIQQSPSQHLPHAECCFCKSNSWPWLWYYLLGSSDYHHAKSYRFWHNGKHTVNNQVRGNFCVDRELNLRCTTW